MSAASANDNRGLVAGSRYELLVKVALGGTATVFVGRQAGANVDDLVAIKRLHPYLAQDELSRAQMKREAGIAHRVVHDNLVRVHGLEEIGDELLLVMDYVEGGSLAVLLDKGPLPLPSALRIFFDAASGLSALHGVLSDEGKRIGFVHRDISPQNILLGVDGLGRLGDFGLVKRTDVSTTHTTALRGKIAYMAPEQVEGEPATQRSDIFSLGVVAWEMFAGERLFRGVNDADSIRRVLTGKVPNLPSRMPSQLNAILRRALSKEPEDRFAEVDEFSKAVREAVEPTVPAARADMAALVQSALSESLAIRRETLKAMLDPDTTATDLVDMTAMVGQSLGPLTDDPTIEMVDDAEPAGGAPPSRPEKMSMSAELLADARGGERSGSEPSARAAGKLGSSKFVIAALAASVGALVTWANMRADVPPTAESSSGSILTTPASPPTPSATTSPGPPPSAPVATRRVPPPSASAATSPTSPATATAPPAEVAESSPTATDAGRAVPSTSGAARQADSTTAGTPYPAPQRGHTPKPRPKRMVVPSNPYR